MKRSLILAVLGVAGLCASAAVAGPNPKLVKGWKPTKVTAKPAPGIYTPTDGAFSDNFDSYANGSAIIGQGAWVGWFGSPTPDAWVSNEQASSGPNSLRLTVNPGGLESDVVHVHNITGGKWEYTAKTYMPSTSVGIGYFILLNTYPAFQWSLDMAMNPATNVVNTIEFPDLVQFPNGVQNQVPLVEDAWVDIRCEIDLDAGTSGRLDVYYNNQPVTTGIAWNPLSFARTLQALDLYSAGCDKFFYDDVELEAVGGCYPDCNGDLVLNLADFGCFQTAFAGGNMYADCNGDLLLNLADFGCFQTSFAAGCP